MPTHSVYIQVAADSLGIHTSSGHRQSHWLATTAPPSHHHGITMASPWHHHGITMTSPWHNLYNSLPASAHGLECFCLAHRYRKIPPDRPVSPMRPSLTSCQGSDHRLWSAMPYCTADRCSTRLQMYATVHTLLTFGRCTRCTQLIQSVQGNDNE